MLNKDEKNLLEAIDSMLQQDARLGLSIHDTEENSNRDSAERGFEYLHNQIDEMFALRSAELTYADSINQAFKKVHNYKYLDDPSFPTAMKKEMVAQAVPAEERHKALSFIPQIIDELKEEQAEWAEKDSGFNPELEEIMKLSRPEQNNELEILDDWGYETNVEEDED